MSEINTSPEIGELVKALAAAQLEFGPVRKDSDNPYYASKYADLATVIRATQPALAKHGLVVTQWPCNDTQAQEAGVTSILMHSSGQGIRSKLMLSATGSTKGGGIKYDAQTVGIAITYARRYSYQAIVGVAAELDDDANSISEPAGTKEAAQSAADRIIADHKAKKANAGDLRAPSPPNSVSAKESPANAATGGETVVLTHMENGLVALSGDGLNIVRSGMTKDDLDFFKITRQADRWVMRASLALKFQDLCARCKVGCVIMDPPVPAPTPGPVAPEKATLPPFVNPAPTATVSSADPILEDYSKPVPKPGKKACMYVTWNGRHHSTFDHGIWPILEGAKGKPVMLEVKASGKYSNIVRILRVDGISFEDSQETTYRAGDSDLPF